MLLGIGFIMRDGLGPDIVDRLGEGRFDRGPWATNRHDSSGAAVAPDQAERVGFGLVDVRLGHGRAQLTGLTVWDLEPAAKKIS